MKLLVNNDHLQYVARAAKKPLLYIAYSSGYMGVNARKGSKEEFDEAFAEDLKILRRDLMWLKKLPRDEQDEVVQRILFDGNLIIICDDVEEQQQLYAGTLGDDDSGAVYALTVSAKGEFQNENT